MAVVATRAGANATTADVLRVAGSAESGSEHPMAKAIAVTLAATARWTP